MRDGADTPDLRHALPLLGRCARRHGVVTPRRTETAARVALKVLDVPGTDGDLANRLIARRGCWRLCEHPGIVPVHDVGTLAVRPRFLHHEIVEGIGSDIYLSRSASFPDLCEFFSVICDAVRCAPCGVLHRDLSPANIMVGPFGEVWCGLGLAKSCAQKFRAVRAKPIRKHGFRKPEPQTLPAMHGNFCATERCGDGHAGYMSPGNKRAGRTAFGRTQRHLWARRTAAILLTGHRK